MASAEEAILRTLIYSDIFDYPLTEHEVWHFLIADKKFTQKEIHVVLHETSQYWEKKNGYIFLKGREKLVTIRKKRGEWSAEKIIIGVMASRLLARIPSVLFVGISGSVARYNARKNDDIDLFIITASKTLWITRFIIVFLLHSKGILRRFGQEHSNDQLCFNFFLSEDYLEIPRERQDIYAACEVTQVLPLFSRNNTYQRFLHANSWREKFLPNTKFLPAPLLEVATKSTLLFLFGISDPFFHVLQLLYMKRHKTTEIVAKHIAAFHPKDHRKIVLEEFERRCKLKSVYRTGYSV